MHQIVEENLINERHSRFPLLCFKLFGTAHVIGCSCQVKGRHTTSDIHLVGAPEVLLQLGTTSQNLGYGTFQSCSLMITGYT